jgi:hypothetical protein
MSKDWPLLRILKDLKDCKDVNYTKGNNKSVHKPKGLFLTETRNKELVSEDPSSERGTNKRTNKEQTNEAI